MVRADSPFDPEAPGPVSFCEAHGPDPCDGPCATQIDTAAAHAVAWHREVGSSDVLTIESEALALPVEYAVRVRTAYVSGGDELDVLPDRRAVDRGPVLQVHG